MKKIQKILSATDLSASSIVAAQRAALLAKLHGAHLELLNVVEASLVEQLFALLGNSAQEKNIDIIDDARTSVRDIAAQLHTEYDIAASVKVVSGKVIQCLSDSADAQAADLVVMGARGESVAKDVLIGSTAENMMQKTGHPVLIVKQAPIATYQKVLVPVDFSQASLSALRLARRMAPQAELVVMNAFVVPYEGKLRMALVDDDTIGHYRDLALNDSLRQLRDFTRSAGLGANDCSIVAINGDAWMSVLDQEKALQCDLIVVGKHGKSLLEDFLLGSVTKMILSHSKCDVLVAL